MEKAVTQFCHCSRSTLICAALCCTIPLTNRRENKGREVGVEGVKHCGVLNRKAGDEDMLIRVSSLTFREVNEWQKKKKKLVELDYHFTPKKKKTYWEKKQPVFEFTGFVPRAKDNDSQRSKYEKCVCDTLKVLVNIQFRGPILCRLNSVWLCFLAVTQTWEKVHLGPPLIKALYQPFVMSHRALMPHWYSSLVCLPLELPCCHLIFEPFKHAEDAHLQRIK